MDQSFELLSSMSPKRVLKQKLPRKGATLLALKKNIRRSSMFENASPTVKNENLFIVESNVTESTTNSVKSTESLPRDLNQTPIVISDTDESFKSIENNEPVSINENVITSSIDTETKNKLLPDEKLEDIKRWIASVDIHPQKSTDVSTFSEVSTIYGDENLSKFIPKVKGSAVNSTFIDIASKKFDELFVRKYTNLNVPSSIPSNDRDLKKTIKNPTVDGSQKLGVEKKIQNKTMKSTPAMSKYHIGLLSNKVSEYTLDDPKTGNTELEDETDLKYMLDSLYGEQWRKKEDLILPKTEPRKNNVLKNYNVTNSERKPTASLLYKNSYLEIGKGSSKGLLKNLQTSRLKTNLESPLLTRLKLVCDSDSSSDKSCDDRVKPQTLNFNDNSSDEKSPENSQTSKYFKKTQTKLKYLENGVSNKENFKLPDKNERTDKPKVKKKLPKPGKIKCNPAIDVERSQTLKLNTENIIISTKSDAASSSSNSSTNKKTDKKISTSSSISISSDEEWDKKIDKIHRSSLANGTYSFLESLSGSVPILRCDMAARIYRSNFKVHRDQLLDKLFKLYNEHIFNNTIPRDTILEWNDRMRGTAGFCYCRKITRRTGAIERSVRIVLASKVVDSADRLRDTLVHEMCHAATWVVNCISDGHGSYWKAWALKAMRAFPELPPIKRCHDYVINTKYTYKCTGCGYSIGRHTKSLDIERKRCGHCYGKFEVLINKTTKKGETKSVVATPKKAATGFALFVKENYGIYKNPSTKHGDVMKILGQKFQEMKVKA